MGASAGRRGVEIAEEREGRGLDERGGWREEGRAREEIYGKDKVRERGQSMS